MKPRTFNALLAIAAINGKGATAYGANHTFMYRCGKCGGTVISDDPETLDAFKSTHFNNKHGQVLEVKSGKRFRVFAEQYLKNGELDE